MCDDSTSDHASSQPTVHKNPKLHVTATVHSDTDQAVAYYDTQDQTSLRKYV